VAMPPMLRRAAATSPQMVEGEKSVTNILEELDAAVAAEGEVRAARLKTEAEKIAKRKAEEDALVASGKVTTFGARLDDDVAGLNVVNKERVEEWEKLFDRGLALMKRGEYKQAVTAFTQATAAAPGGLTGRKGGQYAIYLAQALQANGRKKEAVGLLKRCESHPDADVRKIADGVLYVMQAPELVLDSDNFVTIPSLEESDNWGARRRMVEDKDPPPEKYSLEWYVEEAEKKKKARAREPEPADPTPALLASVALVGLTVALKSM